MELIFVALIIIIFLMLRARFKWPGPRTLLDNIKERKRYKQLAAINAYRAEFDLSPLILDSQLNRLAKNHSLNMAKSGKCYHESEKKRADQLRKMFGTIFVGENCFSYPARDYVKRISGRLVPGWLRAPANRTNILNRRYRKIGIGIVSEQGTVYTTHIFSG
jgi:uncharacterized protein YkwD